MTEKQINENLDNFNFYEGSENPHAINILNDNQEEIDWFGLSANPAIFREINDDSKKISIIN